MRTGTDLPRTTWRALAVLLAVLVVLAACGGGGGGDDDAGGTGGDADTSAWLRVAIPGTGVPVEAAGMWDPTKARTRANLDTTELIYDTLMRAGRNGELEPGLAESARAVDPQTVEIVLREGVTFSDGTPFDAEAVKAGLERNIAARNLTGMRPEIFDVTEIVVDSPTKLTLRLGRPVAGAVVTYTAGIEMIIVAPSAHENPDANPIGAGPFVLEEYVPNAVLRMRKNPDYFQADEVKVAGLEFVAVSGTDPAALQNGLRSGQIDLTSKQGKTIADAVAGATDLEVITEVDPNAVVGLVWCKSRPPLDDVRVRRALAMAIDRDEINDFLYQGTGEIAWGLFPESHPFHDPDQVGAIEHDPEAAKRLLAEAGYPNGFSIGMIIGAGGDPQRAAEVIQQQWAAIGVRLSLSTTTNPITDFYQGVKEPIHILHDLGTTNIVRQYGTAQSVANVCQYADPAFMAALNRIPSLAYGSDEFVEQYHRVEDLARDQLVRFPLVNPPRSVIHSTRVAGVRIVDDYGGSPLADISRAYVKR